MKATASILINRPIEEVFDFVSKIENMDRWVDGVSGAHTTSEGEVGIGSTFASRYTYQGRTSDIRYEVTVFDPPHRFGTRSTEGPFPFEGLIELKPEGGGVRIYNTIDAGSDSLATSVMFALGRPLLRRMMKKQLHGELETLKAILESSKEEKP